MRVITEKELRSSLFAEIQSIELKKGSCHYGDYSQWCISGKDVEQAIINLFAEEGVFKPTKDCNECESAIRADTVRKMQERLKAEAHENIMGRKFIMLYVEDIDQIAKELIGDE